MQLTLSAEQESYQSSLAAFFTAVSDTAQVRRLMDTDAGFEQVTWQRACTELGIAGLTVPESFGGSAAGVMELVLAFEEMGRTLCGIPALSSVALATTALLVSEDEEACQRWLPGLVGGSASATLFWSPSNDHRVDVAGDGVELLTGTLNAVLDGYTCDLLLVPGPTEHGATLFAVDLRETDTVWRRALPVFDLTRKFASVSMQRTPAAAVGRRGDGRRIIAAALERGRICLAAEQLGATTHCLADAVEYGRTRHQFGRPIGSYQAVAHRCADMLVDRELLRSAVRFAAWAADRDPGEAALAAALASLTGSQASVRAAEANLQIHGGIGFTWEHSAHLYLKRAKVSEVLFGAPLNQREILGEMLGV